MGEWKEYQLDELASVTGGKRLPPGAFLTDTPNSHPYIRTRDLAGNKVDANALQFVPDDVFPHIKQYIVTAGDIIVSVVGTIGLCAMIPEELHNASLTENCNRISGFKTTLVNPEYLFFYLTGSVGQDELRQRTVGSTQPKLPMYNLREMPVPLPPIEEQRAIASVLSSLDAKIDLLHRQNKTLEAMAETLFRQWFVEEAEEGWEEGALGDIMTVQGGTTPSTQNPAFWDGEYCWTTPRDLSGDDSLFLFDTARKITEAGLKQIGSGLLPVGTLLLSSRAPVGYTAFAAVPVAINQGYIAINANESYSNFFIYLWLKANMETVKGHANGSTFQEISKSAFKTIEITIPPKERVEEFDQVVEPLFDKVKSNQVQTQSLTKLRDTLLPKLMSGEVRVEQ